MKHYSGTLVFLLLAGLCLIPLLAKPTAQAAECPLPKIDIPGKDIADFPRYPNSVRVRFTRETEKNVITIGKRASGAEVTYRSNDSLDNILNFYNRQLTEKGWELASSNYMGEASIYMVFSRGENNILFSLRPYTSGFGSRRRDDANEESSAPGNCFVIQVFRWNEKDAKPLERMSPAPRDRGQSSRRFGR